ncbi:hypothetical protein OC846_002189 [Tilletia horrida]|uniref:F-box domain-containing protein n=1 Tax=Tilletia horrida TaxID=155126 RepID=A0AAN6JZ58_9BASI|nr:hypothetical protein OC846_002189 [Tilletia horrida]KAK0563233.1 hypothetical protein OC861_004915 [Tilletia horrida]
MSACDSESSTSGRKRLVLPPEIAVRIAAFLQPESELTYPLCLRKRPSSPFRLGDLHAFASTCLSLRCLLAPFFWSSLVFHYPDQLLQWQDVMHYYSNELSPIPPPSAPVKNEFEVDHHANQDGPSTLTFEERKQLKLRRRERLRPDSPEADSSAPGFEFNLATFPPDADCSLERPQLPNPLLLVRNCYIAFPRRFGRFNVQAFLSLLRQLPSLEYLSWDAEITPPSSLWEIVPQIRGLHIDCKVFYQVRVPYAFQPSYASLNLCWQGAASLSKLQNLESLTLTTYDANLLPRHIPPFLLGLPQPLLALDMSSSKTSMLHEPQLIEAGCFSRLEHLTIFAVTPEQPLDRALISAGGTLKTLNLFADVNGGFRNYDDLWRSITGHMKVLESLTVDPHPQQNTAPSFVDFVEATPTLARINGRVTNGLPPCLSLFDPEHITGALAY